MRRIKCMLSKKAFTLIELVVAVAIIAVLSAIAVPTMSGTISRANRSADNSSAKAIEDAIKYAIELNVVGSSQPVDNVGSALKISGLENDILTAKQRGCGFYYHNPTGAVTAEGEDPDGSGTTYLLLSPDMPLVNNSGTWIIGAPVPATGVTLDRTTLMISVGTAVKLNAAVVPANATQRALTWASSNNGVAAVDNKGNVTSVAPGSARITVTVTGTGLSAACDVTVIIPATGVTLDRTEISATEGDLAVKLTATITPSNATQTALTWSSSNTAVATVDANGNVTPVAPGEAQITVTVTGTEFSASCDVTVLRRVIPATGITLNKNTLNMILGDPAQQLIATITPSNTTQNDLTWSSSNPSVATVDSSGTVTALAPGSAQIKVTVTDNTSVSAICNVTVVRLQPQIALNKTSITMPRYNDTTISATFTMNGNGTITRVTTGPQSRRGYFYNAPNGNKYKITWVSSNPEVVILDYTDEGPAVWYSGNTLTLRVDSYNRTGSGTITITLTNTADSRDTVDAACQVVVS